MYVMGFRVHVIFFPSVLVQLIARKCSSPNWPVMCRVGH